MLNDFGPNGVNGATDAFGPNGSMGIANVFGPNGVHSATDAFGPNGVHGDSEGCRSGTLVSRGPQIHSRPVGARGG